LAGNSIPYETVVSMEHISKQFGGVYALNDVSFNVRKEIHAIVGHNGAGKTTLMKILMGALKPDAGKVFLRGKDLHLNSPREGLRSGIAMVWQELANFPNMTVTENVLMQRFVMKKGTKTVDWKASHELCHEYLIRIDLDIDPKTKMRNLPLAYQQLVEFAKAMSFDPSVLILDEPTSSLSVREQEILYEKVRLIRDKGVAIVFISHKLDEVLMLSDRISVFRDGNKILTENASDLTKEDIVTAIVGKKTDLTMHLHHEGTDNAQNRKIVLEAKNLSFKHVLKDFSMQAHKGEVLGLVGVAGSGISEVGKILMGIERDYSGEFFLEDKKQKYGSPKNAVMSGLGYVPKERKDEGVIPMMSVGDNIILATLHDVSKSGFIRKKLKLPLINKVLETVDLLPRNPFLKMESLSGGNQQKSVIGRWICKECKALILDEPTRGVDVGAIHKIYSLIRDLAESGLCVIVISSEFEETHSIADRIMVLNDGVVVSELDPKRCIWETLLALAVK
jgi:ABC-type sugar transport system ATPase subunit